jgi:hypothetical protein
VRKARSPALFGASVTEPDVPSGTDGLAPSTPHGVPGAEPRYPRARTVRFPALFGVPGAEPGVPRRARAVRPRTPLMGCEGENQEYPDGHERFTVPGVPFGAEERARSTLAGAKGSDPDISGRHGIDPAVPTQVQRARSPSLHRDGMAGTRPPSRVERTRHGPSHRVHGTTPATLSGDAGIWTDAFHRTSTTRPGASTRCAADLAHRVLAATWLGKRPPL